MLRRLLFSLAALVIAGVAHAQVTEYDFSTLRDITSFNADVGSFNNGVISGEEWVTTTTSTSDQLLSPPATPLPADLPFVTVQNFYVLSGGVNVLWLSRGGTEYDNSGNSLSFSTILLSSTTTTATDLLTYTGGTGVYSGAYGSANSLISFAPGTTETVVSENQLFIPSPVPEPSTYALLLSGLILLGFVLRRNKENALAA
jgi:hypothetical protein